MISVRRVGLKLSPAEQSATVFDLPGCTAVGATIDQVRGMLPIVVTEFTHWLAQHGEIVDTRLATEITEQIDAETAEGVEGEFVFDDDRRPLTDAEVARALRWMDCARADLLSVIRALPDEILDWRPPLSAMARVDAWKPMPLTIREILADIASAESYYRTGLRDGRVADESDRIISDLATQRQLTREVLTGLAEGDRGRVFSPTRSWQSASERWTARKTIRRIIAHERFHTAEIQQRLTWILLGVPDLNSGL